MANRLLIVPVAGSNPALGVTDWNDIRAHISERKRIGTTTHVRERWDPSWPPPLTSGGYSQVDVAELVYALGLGSSEATHEGSSPFIDTK